MWTSHPKVNFELNLKTLYTPYVMNLKIIFYDFFEVNIITYFEMPEI